MHPQITSPNRPSPAHHVEPSTGADVMKRIAAPMVGGVVTSVLMELLVHPVICFLWKSQELRKEARLAGRLLED